MNFHKMHGLGNDFVVVAADRLPDDPCGLAQAVCDRHFGVGADGLVFVLPSERADVSMRIFTPTAARRSNAATRSAAWASSPLNRAWFRGQRSP